MMNTLSGKYSDLGIVDLHSVTRQNYTALGLAHFPEDVFELAFYVCELRRSVRRYPDDAAVIAYCQRLASELFLHVRTQPPATPFSASCSPPGGRQEKRSRKG